MPLLFSYGSNSPARLGERIGRDIFRANCVPAWLSGHRRAFVGMSRTWGGGVATVLPAKGRTVYGYVTKISAAEKEIVDRYEGVAIGAYVPTPMRVKTDKGVKSALVYVAGTYKETRPTRAYLEACASNVGLFWSDDDGRPLTWKDFAPEDF